MVLLAVLHQTFSWLVAVAMQSEETAGSAAVEANLLNMENKQQEHFSQRGLYISARKEARGTDAVLVSSSL